MQKKFQALNNRQLLFKDLFVGTLIYAVVLGFLNDYTNIVDAKSFSTIFFAAAVLETLTIFMFIIKNRVLLTLRDKNRALIALCIWLIMFSSKFIFLWVIDAVFVGSININGFFGILAVIIATTLIHKLAEKSFIILGDKEK